jgi:hypothetical protein
MTVASRNSLALTPLPRPTQTPTIAARYTSGDGGTDSLPHPGPRQAL